MHDEEQRREQLIRIISGNPDRLRQYINSVVEDTANSRDIINSVKQNKLEIIEKYNTLADKYMELADKYAELTDKYIQLKEQP